jgi:hypothetical protein
MRKMLYYMYIFVYKYKWSDRLLISGCYYVIYHIISLKGNSLNVIFISFIFNHNINYDTPVVTSFKWYLKFLKNIISKDNIFIIHLNWNKILTLVVA